MDFKRIIIIALLLLSILMIGTVSATENTTDNNVDLEKENSIN